MQKNESLQSGMSLAWIDVARLTRLAIAETLISPSQIPHFRKCFMRLKGGGG